MNKAERCLDFSGINDSMASSSVCPFCQATVPSVQLERHANNHFEDEELERDLDLALQIALSPLSSTSDLNEQVNNQSFRIIHGKLSPSATSMSCSMSGDGEINIDEKIWCLISLQGRSNFYRVEDGLVALLRNCLNLEGGNSISILSGRVDHFQCIESEDVGWGCGWRNIQMLSSHLLMERQETREFLFGGSGFVPDLPSLQRWLEIAWERGFDAFGSSQFNHQIYGSEKWIGTTECATLFRSFGVRARIVDFGPKDIRSLIHSISDSNSGEQELRMNIKGKTKAIQMHGPMNKYLLMKGADIPQEGTSRHEDLISISNSLGNDLGRADKDFAANAPTDKYFTREAKGNQVLIDWIWNYFSDKKFIKSGFHEVILSEKAPLYFQHDGHSRVVVGIQVKHERNGKLQHNLLILDPAHSTRALERSLRANVGWQKFIKRGAHTLKKPQYQLCYIDPGIASGEEMEQLKTLESDFFEL